MKFIEKAVNCAGSELVMMQPKQFPNEAEQASSASRETFSCPVEGQLQQMKENLMAYYDAFPGNASFLCAFEEALFFAPVAGQRVYTRVLAEDADTRLVLLGLHESQPFPVHDHGGAAACHVVLYGCLRTRHYREVAQINHAMVRLECCEDRRAGAGEPGFVDRERAIHGLESVGERVLVLNLQSRQLDSRERHWYFPASESQGGEQLWYRIRRKEHKTRNHSDKRRGF
ncbi:MAG: hypothetical protein PVH71_09535 [Chromatiales bacterium]|jgi:hypothetical protein